MAHELGLTELYYSAALTLILKVIALPWILHRLIHRLGAQWDSEPLVNIPDTMLVGLVLVIFAFGLAQPISMLATTITRHTLGIALAVILLSFLMMITRRKAMTQVIGFLAMENGLFFAATSATYGMPMVIELGIALDVLVGVFHSRDLLLPDPRAVRQPRSASPGIAQGGLNVELLLVLGLPLLGPSVLALLGARRFAAEAQCRHEPRHVARRLAAGRASHPRRTDAGRARAILRRFVQRVSGRADGFRRLHDLALFAALTCASRSTTDGSLPGRLRLYHSMYQLFMVAMLLALLTNNMGLLWVAMEAATLSTVLLVSLYRTRASLEAAWKYFILCGVGIAQALVRHDSAVLCRGADARPRGHDALLWTHLNAVKGQLEPRVLGLAFVFLLVGYGTKVGLAPLHNWLPDAHAEGPTPVSAVLSGLLLNVALYAVIRCKVLVEGSVGSVASGPHADGLWTAVGGARRVLPLEAARYQAALRLLLDRAHGHHHLCLRLGRSGRQFRGAAAHDRALAHQVVHLLHRRARVADGRHAANGRHSRPARASARRSAGDSCWDRSPFSACRHSASLRASFSFLPPPCESIPGRRLFS